MTDILIDIKRTAGKQHACDFCGDVIQKGETYDYAKLKSDHLYEWRSHEKCSFIADKLWDYIGPDEGMTQEHFEEGCHEFCQEFICPQCPDNDNEAKKNCKLNKYHCIDKIYTHLQTHDFKCVKDEYCWKTWKCIPKGGMEDA